MMRQMPDMQTPKSPQTPSNEPEMMRQIQEMQTPPPMQQATAFSHQHMRQMEMPQNQEFPQKLQPSMMTNPNFFKQLAPNSQQMPLNEHQMMRQMPAAASQFTAQAPMMTQQDFMLGNSRFDPSELMRFEDFRDNENPEDQVDPLPPSHHHKHHHHNHVKVEPSEDGPQPEFVEPQTPVHKHVSNHHSKLNKKPRTDEDENEETIQERKETQQDEDELGSTIDDKTTVGQVNSN